MYMMCAGQYLKVGISHDPATRRSQLEAASPVPIGLVCAYPFNHASDVEQQTHRALKPFRSNREWYLPPFSHRHAARMLRFFWAAEQAGVPQEAARNAAITLCGKDYVAPPNLRQLTRYMRRHVVMDGRLVMREK